MFIWNFPSLSWSLKPTFGCEVHANEEEEEEEAMKQPPASSYLYHQKQQQDEEIEEAVGVTIGMEVDDAEPIDILPDFDRQQPPVDADFFNSFEDDFDDQDIAWPRSHSLSLWLPRYRPPSFFLISKPVCLLGRVCGTNNYAMGFDALRKFRCFVFSFCFYQSRWDLIAWFRAYNCCIGNFCLGVWVSKNKLSYETEQRKIWIPCVLDHCSYLFGCLGFVSVRNHARLSFIGEIRIPFAPIA